MGPRLRPSVAGWAGSALIVVGFLLVAVSYFLLPLYVTTLNCFDACTPPKTGTAWELSLNVLSHVQNTPIPNALDLALAYLPLLGAVVGTGGSIAYLVHPRRMFAGWSNRAFVAGTVALIIIVPFLVVMTRPDAGSVGMVLGYGLFWGGNHLVLSARPLARRAG